MLIVGMHRDDARTRPLSDAAERSDNRAAAERRVEQRHQQRILDKLLELAPVIEHPIHREGLMRQIALANVALRTSSANSGEIARSRTV